MDAIAGDSIGDMNLVIDTNVFVAALLSESGASRQVIKRCLLRHYHPCMSLPLFAEFQDVLGRESLFARGGLDADERLRLFAAFLSVCKRTEIYFLWRPNLVDEGDNHVLELAVAAGAKAIVTHNISDFSRAQLRFPALRIITPAQLLKEDDKCLS